MNLSINHFTFNSLLAKITFTESTNSKWIFIMAESNTHYKVGVKEAHEKYWKKSPLTCYVDLSMVPLQVLTSPLLSSKIRGVDTLDIMKYMSPSLEWSGQNKYLLTN